MYWINFESCSNGHLCFQWEGSGWDEDAMFCEWESEVEVRGDEEC